jgi:hypothetical protein
LRLPDEDCALSGADELQRFRQGISVLEGAPSLTQQEIIELEVNMAQARTVGVCKSSLPCKLFRKFISK